MPDTSVPERVRFTLEIDSELLVQLDERREQMRAERGFNSLSRSDFFAHVGKRYLEGESRRDQRGRPIRRTGTSS